MLKKILGILVLMLSSSVMAEDPPLQVRLTNVVISNTYETEGRDRNVIWVEYNTVVDDPVHAESFLPPCASTVCYYGILWAYQTDSGLTWVYQFVDSIGPDGQPLGLNANNNAIRYGPNDRWTYAEANKRLLEQLGSPSGVVRQLLVPPYKERTKRARICLGVITRGWANSTNPAAYDSIIDVGGCSDQNLPLPPVTCETQGSSTLNIQHGTLTSNQLNDANTPKSASSSFGLSCSDNILVKLSLSPTSIQLTDGLVSNITLKQDGKTVGPNDNIPVLKGNISQLEVTSTLSATGKITPNAYSGSAILILNLY